eukprot:COSAG05_NODE_1289_length_5268_cov_4.125943_1_plen_277_part_00
MTRLLLCLDIIRSFALLAIICGLTVGFQNTLICGARRAHSGACGCMAVKRAGSLDKTCQCSDWEQRPLSAAQLHYAALDAWCLTRLADVVVQHLVTTGGSGSVSAAASGGADADAAAGGGVEGGASAGAKDSDAVAVAWDSVRALATPLTSVAPSSGRQRNGSEHNSSSSEEPAAPAAGRDGVPALQVAAVEAFLHASDFEYGGGEAPLLRAIGVDCRTAEAAAAAATAPVDDGSEVVRDLRPSLSTYAVAVLVCYTRLPSASFACDSLLWTSDSV